MVADERLLAKIREIAQREHVSFAEVVRQGLEWRVAQAERRPRFIGAGRSTAAPHDTARRAGEMEFEPPAWR